MKKNLALSLLCAALFATTGCSSGRTADSLSEGETVVVDLALQQDGSLEATAVDVGEEDDGINCEQEGEHEGENVGCDVAALAAEMLVGSVHDDGSGEGLSVLGIQVDMTSMGGAATAKTYWFRGEYVGADQFSGEVIKSSKNERLRMLGQITAVEAGADGTLSIVVFDRVIQVDGALPLNSVPNLDDSAEADINCDQEGGNEGENAGC